jgi:hypothetical protein
LWTPGAVEVLPTAKISSEVLCVVGVVLVLGVAVARPIALVYAVYVIAVVNSVSTATQVLWSIGSSELRGCGKTITRCLGQAEASHGGRCDGRDVMSLEVMDVEHSGMPFR